MANPAEATGAGAGSVPDRIPTAAVADAIVRLGLELRLAPASIRRLERGAPIAGSVVPCRHFGSVDVFLDALERAAPGSILVVDNEGRLDEGCVGDLVAAESQAGGIQGIVIWGAHRDTRQLRPMRVGIWSLASYPAGPARSRSSGSRSPRVMIGDQPVTADDIAIADDDGVVFVHAERWPEVRQVAASIVAVEARQARLLRRGTSLRDQLQFAAYRERRRASPGYSFREHLRSIGGAIET